MSDSNKHVITSDCCKPINYVLEYVIDPFKGELLGKAEIIVKNNCSHSINEISLLLNRGLRIISSNHEYSQNPCTIMFPSLNKNGIIVNHIVIKLPKELHPDSVDRIIVSFEGSIEIYQEIFPYIKDRVGKDYTLIRPDAFSYPVVSDPDFNQLVKYLPRQRFTYKLTVRVPNSYVAATLGELVSRKTSRGYIVYVFKEKIRDWRIDLAVSRFETIVDPENNIIVYTFPEDKEHGNRILYEMKRVLKLYTKLLGDPPIWRGYTVIEIPDGWGGQACMTGALLPASNIRDPVKISGLYHELAHLWNVVSGEETPSRFLDEGLASFLQIIAEEKLLNKDLGKRIDELRQRFLDITRKQTRLREISVREYGRYGLTEASYVIGPIIFYIIKEVLGENCLWNTLRTFIKEYSEKPAKLEDLVHVFEKTCGPKAGKFLEELLFTNILAKLLWRGRSIHEILRELIIYMNSILGQIIRAAKQ